MGIRGLARLGQGSLRSPFPSLGTVFSCHHWHTLHSTSFTSFFFSVAEPTVHKSPVHDLFTLYSHQTSDVYSLFGCKESNLCARRSCRFPCRCGFENQPIKAVGELGFLRSLLHIVEALKRGPGDTLRSDNNVSKMKPKPTQSEAVHCWCCQAVKVVQKEDWPFCEKNHLRMQFMRYST